MCLASDGSGFDQGCSDPRCLHVLYCFLMILKCMGRTRICVGSEEIKAITTFQFKIFADLSKTGITFVNRFFNQYYRLL